MSRCSACAPVASHSRESFAASAQLRKDLLPEKANGAREEKKKLDDAFLRTEIKLCRYCDEISIANDVASSTFIFDHNFPECRMQPKHKFPILLWPWRVDWEASSFGFQMVNIFRHRHRSPLSLSPSAPLTRMHRNLVGRIFLSTYVRNEWKVFYETWHQCHY